MSKARYTCGAICSFGTRKEFISYRMRTKRAYIAFAQQIYRTAQAVYRNEIIKPGCIVNKTFVEMLDKLGYDIQITYVKKETN